jgi:PAS domain S-box-containing protein
MAPTRPAVLLLCEDPVAGQLLRSLLRAVPGPPPELIAAETVDEALGAAPRAALCLLEPGFAGVPAHSLVERLRAVAPSLEVCGVLGAVSRHGDRADLLLALRAGMRDALLLEELTVARLATLLRGSAAAPGAPALLPGPPEPVERAPTAAAGPSGEWRIDLAAQHALFDAATLSLLGHSLHGNGIAEWKALIHPEDVDRLLGAVQRVLEGRAAPEPLAYRLRRAGGGWLSVRSDAIAVERAPDGTPRAISGRFHALGLPATETPLHPAAPLEPAVAAQDTREAIAQQCQTALLRFAREPDGGFRLRWFNAAATAACPGARLGAAADAVLPPCDGVHLVEALGRVADTGIGESHDALLLDRAEPPAWRRHQLSRLGDGSVLVEATDLSELMNLRHARRAGDELAQYVVRSLPLTTLVLDDGGRVLHCLATAGGPLGDDPLGIEDHTLAELLGPAAGEACLEQIVRTLNTGRPALATLERDAGAGPTWIDCHTTLLRARPGMPPRVVLGLLDATARVSGTRELRADIAQLRAALKGVPLPLYLKDAEGRYTALSPAFERLMGVEEAMLAGKTDFEVFPDEVAAELHASERHVLGEGAELAALREAGVGAARAMHWCMEFPVRSPAGELLGCAGIWVAPRSLPQDAAARLPSRASRSGELERATASVVNEVEDALTDTGDYAGVLRQLEQLVETTMQAQAIMHSIAGQPLPPPARPLVALAPLVQEIFDLERILLPPTARFENHVDGELPPAHCEPVAFHQILLRAIRHARRTLGPQGTLCVRLRSSTGGGRGCLSCSGGLEGHYVELVIEDTDSCLGEGDIDYLTGTAGEARVAGSALDDLAEIHALAHAQGGHLQIQRNVPTGTSVHVFFRAGDAALLVDANSRQRSTIAQFPRGRSGNRG